MPAHTIACTEPPFWKANFSCEAIYFVIKEFCDKLVSLMQRICDDVPAFTEGSTNLMFGITRKIFGVLAFSGTLSTPIRLGVTYL